MTYIFTFLSNASNFGLATKFCDYVFDENWQHFFFFLVSRFHVVSSLFCCLFLSVCIVCMTATPILCDRRGGRALSLSSFWASWRLQDSFLECCGTVLKRRAWPAAPTRPVKKLWAWLTMTNTERSYERRNGGAPELNSSAMAIVMKTESQIKVDVIL